MKKEMRISKVHHHITRFAAQLFKIYVYVFGRRAKVGRLYVSCFETTSGLEFGQCSTLYYDAQSEVLIAYTLKRELFLFCSGDIASYRKSLYAEHITICLGNQKSIFSYLDSELMDENVLTEDIVISALHRKYHRVPKSSLSILARYYLSLRNQA